MRQVLRGLQSEKQAAESIVRCVWAVQELWCFAPHDSTTWQEAGRLLEHIKAVGRFAAERKVAQAEASMLLREAATYISMALSRFDVAQDVLEQALSMLRCLAGSGDSAACDDGAAATTPEMASTLYELGKVQRYLGSLDVRCFAPVLSMHCLSVESCVCVAWLPWPASLLLRAECSRLPHGIVRAQHQLPRQRAEEMLGRALAMQRSPR